MEALHNLLYLLISFIASVAGAVCGIGGGVVIKPVLDLFQLADVAAVSFLSGCTVLVMSGYSVLHNICGRSSRVDFKTGSFLAAGAVLGGIAGKQLFSLAEYSFPNSQQVGSVQSVCLAAVTLAAFLYTLKREKITGMKVTGRAACLSVGLALGLLSSFLGIGGGPINLVALFFFFGMDTKTAAQNSLYIILFSQAASLLTALVTSSVPDFSWSVLLLMAAGGVGGGILGRVLHHRMKEEAVSRLFLWMMGLIILVSVYNAVRYSLAV